PVRDLDRLVLGAEQVSLARSHLVALLPGVHLHVAIALGPALVLRAIRDQVVARGVLAHLLDRRHEVGEALVVEAGGVGGDRRQRRRYAGPGRAATAPAGQVDA